MMLARRAGKGEAERTPMLMMLVRQAGKEKQTAANADDAGSASWEGGLGKEKQTGADAHDASPVGWESRSRRPLILMMLARRDGR